LQEDKVVGVGAAVTTALRVAVEGGAHARKALASFEVDRWRSGGGHGHSGEEGGDGSELHVGDRKSLLLEAK
jgi:hypothetical protein